MLQPVEHAAKTFFTSLAPQLSAVVCWLVERGNKLKETIRSTESFVRDYDLDDLFDLSKDRRFNDAVDLAEAAYSNEVVGALLGFAVLLAKRQYHLPDWQERAEDIGSSVMEEYFKAVANHVRPTNHNQMCPTYLDLMRWAVYIVREQVGYVTKKEVRQRVVTVPPPNVQEQREGTKPAFRGVFLDRVADLASLMVDPSLVEDGAEHLSGEDRLIAIETQKKLTDALRERLELHFERQPTRTLAVIEYVFGEISPEDSKYGTAEEIARKYEITVQQLQSYKSDMIRTWKKVREKEYFAEKSNEARQ